jgi:hypothetical protein
VSRLDERMIEHRVVFAASHKGEPGQISEDGSCPILPIEPEQSALLWELVCREIATEGTEALAQFRSVATVADGAPNEPNHWKLWAWLTTVRVRTTCPRLRPV